MTGSDGLILFPFQGGKTVATVYTEKPEAPDAAPLWRIVTGEGGALEIVNGKGDAVLILGQDGSVTVPGEMKAGRYLSDKEEETSPEDDGVFRINADGHWHDLPVEYADNGRGSDGCRVYRICACWHHPRSGKYAVCEAVASHSDGSRRRIKSARKHWWGWSGKIKLRWRDRVEYMIVVLKNEDNGRQTVIHNTTGRGRSLYRPPAQDTRRTAASCRRGVDGLQPA